MAGCDRPPIRNPYQTFTAPEFDAFVDDIRQKVTNALKPLAPPASLPYLRSARAPRFSAAFKTDSSSVYEADASEELLDPDDGDNVDDAPRIALNKGKGRAPDEGPGVQGLASLVSISPEDVEYQEESSEDAAELNGYSEDDLEANVSEYPVDDGPEVDNDFSQVTDDPQKYRHYYNGVEDDEEEVIGSDEEAAGEAEYDDDEEEEAGEEPDTVHTRQGIDYQTDSDGAIVIDDDEDDIQEVETAPASPEWAKDKGAGEGGAQEEEEEAETGWELAQEDEPEAVIQQETHPVHVAAYDQDDDDDDELDEEEVVNVYKDEQDRESAVFNSVDQDIFPVEEEAERDAPEAVPADRDAFGSDIPLPGHAPQQLDNAYVDQPFSHGLHPPLSQGMYQAPPPGFDFATQLGPNIVNALNALENASASLPADQTAAPMYMSDAVVDNILTGGFSTTPNFADIVPINGYYPDYGMEYPNMPIDNTTSANAPFNPSEELEVIDVDALDSEEGEERAATDEICAEYFRDGHAVEESEPVPSPSEQESIPRSSGYNGNVLEVDTLAPTAAATTYEEAVTSSNTTDEEAPRMHNAETETTVLAAPESNDVQVETMDPSIAALLLPGDTVDDGATVVVSTSEVIQETTVEVLEELVEEQELPAEYTMLNTRATGPSEVAAKPVVQDGRSVSLGHVDDQPVNESSDVVEMPPDTSSILLEGDAGEMGAPEDHTVEELASSQSSELDTAELLGFPDFLSVHTASDTEEIAEDETAESQKVLEQRSEVEMDIDPVGPAAPLLGALMSPGVSDQRTPQGSEHLVEKMESDADGAVSNTGEEDDPFVHMGTGKGGVGAAVDDDNEEEEIEDGTSAASASAEGKKAAFPAIQSAEPLSPKRPSPSASAPQNTTPSHFTDSATTSPSKASASSLTHDSEMRSPTSPLSEAEMPPPPIGRLTSFNLYRHHHGPIPKVLPPMPLPPKTREDDGKSDAHERASRSSTPSAAASRISASQISINSTRDPNAAVTRSHCTFTKIAIPVPFEESETTEQEDGGEAASARPKPDARERRVVHFVVPGCSLSARDVIEEEGIELCGEATKEENDTKVPELSNTRIDPAILNVLRVMVGHDIMDTACAWLPSPKELALYHQQLKEERAVASKALQAHHARRRSGISGASQAGPSKERKFATPKRKSGSMRLTRQSQPKLAGAQPRDEDDSGGGDARAAAPKLELLVPTGEDVTESESEESAPDDAASVSTARGEVEPAKSSKRRRASTKSSQARKGKNVRSEHRAYVPTEDEHNSDEDEEERPAKRPRRSWKISSKVTSAPATEGASHDAVGPDDVPRESPAKATHAKKRSRANVVPEIVLPDDPKPHDRKRRRRDRPPESIDGISIASLDDDQRSTTTSSSSRAPRGDVMEVVLDAPAHHLRSRSRASSPVPPSAHAPGSPSKTPSVRQPGSSLALWQHFTSSRDS